MLLEEEGYTPSAAFSATAPEVADAVRTTSINDNSATAMEIAEILAAPGKDHMKHTLVVGLVIDALERDADLYHEPLEDGFSPRCFLRFKQNGRIVDLHAGSVVDDQLCGYGLLLKSPLLRTVAAHVSQHVRQQGHEAIVSIGPYYLAATNTWYMALDSIHAVKITSAGAELVGNAIDGLLLLPAGQPIEIDIDAINASTLGMKVESDSAMGKFFAASYSSPTDLQIFSTRIIALLFPQIFDARSIIILGGEKGCGKSVLAEKAGLLIQGERFRVSRLADKREDAEILFTSRTLVVLDNLDYPPTMKKYTDLLCQCVTGGGVEKRQLYSDNTILSFPYIASLILTSIDLSGLKDTLADRSLIITLLPRPKTGNDDGNLRKWALTRRNDVMTEMLGRVKNILAALAAQATYKTEHTLRIHDFAQFLMRSAVHEGWAPKALDALRIVFGVQREEADANNTTLDLVRYFIGSSATCSVPLPAAALGLRLTEAAKILGHEHNTEVRYGCYQIPGLIKKQLSLLKAMFGMRRERDAHTGNYEYWSFLQNPPAPVSASAFEAF